jgi:hypothetical protein
MDDILTDAFRDLQENPVWDWPRGASSTLLAVLKDKEAKVEDRLLAAELSGEVAVIDDALAGCLLEILRDGREPEHLRGRSAIALGPMLEYGEEGAWEDDEAPSITPPTIEKVQAALRATYFDAAAPTAVRRCALEASVRGSQDWHVKAIRAAWASGDRVWRLSAMFCMQYVEGFEPQILKALKSQDPEILGEAVSAAGAWGLDEAWPAIADLLASRQTPRSLLLRAIEAAPSFDPEEALELLGPLERSRDEDIAGAAEEAMAMIDVTPDDEDIDFGDEDDEPNPYL